MNQSIDEINQSIQSVSQSICQQSTHSPSQFKAGWKHTCPQVYKTKSLNGFIDRNGTIQKSISS